MFISYRMSTKQPLSDAEVLKSSESYPWMFGMLVDRYQKSFIRKASYILRSADTAEDAVQDTFVKIYKHADKFSEQKNASFSSWAYKILTNTCYSYASRKALDKERIRPMDFDALDAASSYSDNSLRSEQASFVQSVLSRLPDNLSRLLTLYFFEEKSYEEIADAERLSLSAVKSRLHRAKKQFKNIAVKMI